MSVWYAGRLARPGRLVSRVGVLAVVAIVAACGSSSGPTAGGSGATSQASIATPSGAAVATATSDRTWMDATQPVAARVAALLSQMTLAEKIGQMTQIENKGIDAATEGQLMLGSILSGGGGSPDAGNTPQAWYDMVNAYQQAALGTRLGIPMLYGIDAVHGDNNIYGSTIFPHNVGMGATHDAALVTKECQATALEMNAVGIRWSFGPVIAVPQDVRWGRTYEGYSENTDLVSQLGVACVKGFQGTSLSAPDTTAATLKHFIGDGGTAYGSSGASGPTGPYLLDQGVDQMDEATLLKLFLPPYKAAVDAGARIVMVSYSSTTEGKMHGNKHLITDVLKGQLGFTGFVVSDWGGVDQVVPGDYGKSLAQSINAGIDMVMVPDNYQLFITNLTSLVKDGTVPQSRIDDAVSRILRIKFEMGLFENPMPAAGKLDSVGTAADRAIASQAVAESAILLRTAKGALPIAATQKVLLAGSGADNIGVQSGGWTISWQGASGPITTGTTIKDALSAKLGSNLTYDPAANFASGTKAAVGVVVVAEQPYAEGVGDSATLKLPDDDLALVAKMRPLVDKLVVVIVSGRPMLLDGLSSADAIVAAWLPGTEATGLADVLLGAKPFTGTTPYTWPKTVPDAPRTGKAACDGAVYPFGYGLNSAGKLLGPPAC
jgi:beta-glucosidase